MLVQRFTFYLYSYDLNPQDKSELKKKKASKAIHRARCKYVMSTVQNTPPVCLPHSKYSVYKDGRSSHKLRLRPPTKCALCEVYCVKSFFSGPRNIWINRGVIQTYQMTRFLLKVFLLRLLDKQTEITKKKQ